MNESFVTVVGNVVADPIARPTKTGKPFASFRVASTTRRWDPEQRAFVNGATNFVDVVAFNALGANVVASLEKGHPVIVYGRLRVNQWVTERGDNRTSVEVDAYSVGHDLNRGQTVISRPERSQYDTNDRLADANIQDAFEQHDAEAAEGTGIREVTELEPGLLVDRQTGEVLDPVSVVGAAGAADADGPSEPGGFARQVEDADTDDYVVVSH